MTLKRALLCALVLLCASAVFSEEPIKDQASCSTTWDDTYFYLAFRVDGPDVQSSHSKPNTELTGDDAVEFYIETDNKHSAKITPACFSMAVSASGGSRFRAGSDKESLDATPAFIFKYGATVQGTVNNADDIDMGYNVELAVPWELLKTKNPSLGDMMSFNVIIRRHGDKAGTFVSLSPRVKNEEDTINPAKWVNVVFAAHTFGVATTSAEKILSAKYVVKSPLIDGVVNEREWHLNTSFSIDLPMPPGFVYEAKFPVQRMVFAKYLYWYQADPRREVPVQHIKRPDGASDLSEIPANGTGPWFSYDRVQWHKDELAEMAATGISVALPDYLGAASDGAGFADRGLDCMVSALDELRKEGKTYPMLGMYLDASYLSAGQPLKPETVYGAIESFFDRVPPEFRAYAPAAKPNAGRPGAMVYVAHAESVDAWVPAVLSACSDRFAKEFGCPLVWIGDSGFAQAGNGFDAVVGSTSSRVSIGAVTCDDSYDTQWADLLAANPIWVYCDAWNDFTSGKCIRATEKLGTRRVDSTEAHIKRFLVSRDYSARFLRFDLPKVLSPKQIAQAEVTIRNAGNSAWRAKDGYALGYRWYRNGRFYGESRVRRPLTVDVPPGDTVTLAIGIATVTAVGTPMPEGNCELRLELIRLSDNKWFSALGDLPLMLPVTIGAPAELDATVLSCGVPNMVGVGGTYPITVRVRNDGTQLWAKSATKLECRLFKVQRGASDAPGVEVAIPALKAPFAKDCKPGEIAECKMDLVIAPLAKKTLDLSKPSDDWSYELRFDVLNGTKRLSEAGANMASRAIEVHESDYGPRIVDSELPESVMPGQTLDVKVVIRNTGLKVWDAKRTTLGYRWYGADGVELQMEGTATPIRTKVEPGWPAVVNATVKAPAQEAKYTLVWDLMMDGKWLSGYPLSRGGDMLPVRIDVSKTAEPTPITN